MIFRISDFVMLSNYAKNLKVFISENKRILTYSKIRKLNKELTEITTFLKEL